MSHTDSVLRMLKDNPDGITALDALRGVGTMRLAARIADLREQGYIITTYTVRRGQSNVALYRLREREPMRSLPA